MFKGIDYFDLESGFSSESRMIRDSVRDFVDREFLPIVRDHYRAGGFPTAYHPDAGGDGAPRLQPEGIRAARHRPDIVRPRHAGAGAGRLGAAQLRLRAGGARDVPDPHVRERGAEGTVAPGAGGGEGDRLLRPDRARPRLGPGRDEDEGGEGRGSLRPLRREDVDHERLRRRRGGGVGQARRRGARVPGREGDEGLLRARDPLEALPAGLRHGGARSSTTSGCRRKTSSPACRG